ncbi:flavin reductase [Paenibacillus terrae]|uniref:flavin reductase n=1 Tax=Paenibacillus terrae TaxID=159743 RepID=UPI000AC6FC0D|nr:flavin reductase [Paenibacillus terrae]
MFQHFEIAYEDGISVDVPVLLDAYLAYECKVVDSHTYGDHDWIVGEIQQTYRDDDSFWMKAYLNLVSFIFRYTWVALLILWQMIRYKRRYTRFI